MSAKDKTTTGSVPQVVQTSELTPHQKKINQIRTRLVDTVYDGLDVLHKTIQGEKISRSRIFAAQAVLRFAPNLEQETSGNVHLHFNVPRPKHKTVQAKVVTSPEEEE